MRLLRNLWSAMSKTILVTGGAGFIGARFVARHLERHDADRVIVLDALTYAGNLDRLPPEIRASPRFEFVHGNVADEALVASLVKRADTVVHFAAETHVPRSIADNRIFVETDVMGTQVLLGRIVENIDHIERFIHVSSSEVYGSAVEDPMTEEHPLRPTTPYAAAKCGADRLVYAFAETYGIPAVILRPFNNYGPGQHLEKVVARFISSVLLGEPLSIHGTGAAARDWVFVDDTCAAIELALAAPLDVVRGQVFNIGTGVATSVATLAAMVRELAGGRCVAIQHGADRPGQVALHRADTCAAEHALGFRATTELGAGLERTYRWYHRNPESWRGDVGMRAVAVAGRDGAVHHW